MTPTDNTIQQWEYLTDVVHTYETDVTGFINGYGAEGWELVSAFFNNSTTSYYEDYWRVIFKRHIINNTK